MCADKRKTENRSGAFRHSKSLGQNFLKDAGVIAEIIEATDINEKDLVIEIGPGAGALTKMAAEAAGKLVAVEIDKRLIPMLEARFGTRDDVVIVNEDILKTDMSALIRENRIIDGREAEHVRIIGNLPYYITTPIIMKILEEGVPADSITAMMQKEVADRIAAPPGNKEYGALSVAVQYYCEVTKICDVKRHMFEPQPKVDSAVLRMDVRKEKPVTVREEKVFFQCIKAGFGQRRKTLSNSLSGAAGAGKEKIAQVLKEAGIDGNRRAETLTIEEFATIADCLAKSR